MTRCESRLGPCTTAEDKTNQTHPDPHPKANYNFNNKIRNRKGARISLNSPESTRVDSASHRVMTESTESCVRVIDPHVFKEDKKVLIKVLY